MNSVRFPDDLGSLWTDDLGAHTYYKESPRKTDSRIAFFKIQIGFGFASPNRSEIIGQLGGFRRGNPSKLPMALLSKLKPVV